MKNEYEIMGDVAIIFIHLRKGKTLKCLVDLEDLEKVKSIDGKWYGCFSKYVNSYYVFTMVPDRRKMKNVRIHRLIFDDIEEGKVVDHINHDTLDNRKSNLRIVTQKENMQNRVRHRMTKYGVV